VKHQPKRAQKATVDSLQKVFEKYNAS